MSNIIINVTLYYFDHLQTFVVSLFLSMAIFENCIGTGKSKGTEKEEMERKGLGNFT